jgi:hypothetical protein
VLDSAESERRCGLTVGGEVSLSQFEFLDLEGTLEELLGSLTADGHFHSNLFVSLDGESSDGVLGHRLDGLLVSQILEHLGCLGEFIAGLTSAKVQNELFDPDASHLVVSLLGVLLLIHIFFLNQLNLLIIKAVRPLLKPI